MINLTQKRVEGKCPARRCKEDANGLWVEHRTDPDDPAVVDVVSFCDKHCGLSGGIEVDKPKAKAKKAKAIELPPPEVVEPVPPTMLAELVAEADDLLEAIDMVRGFVVEDQDDVDFAKESLGETKAQFKALEAKRKKATGPMRESIKEIDSWFKPAKDALTEIERVWKGKIKQAHLDFSAHQASLLQAAQVAETPTQAHQALVAAGEHEIDLGGVQLRDNWVYEVVDPSVVPREYWTIDHRALAAAAKLHKGAADIPGVRVWNDPIVAAAPTRKAR